MLIFFIGTLCMMIVPGLVIVYRKRRISKGAVWGFSFLAYLVGYGLALLIAMGLITSGQLAPEEVAVVPGGLITVILVNWLLRWKLREKGLLRENPSWMPDELEEEPGQSVKLVEPAKQVVSVLAEPAAPSSPGKETVPDSAEESSLELLANIQAEAEAERAGNTAQAPQEGAKRKGIPVWVCVVLAVLCVGLGVGCGVLGHSVAELRAERDVLEATLSTYKSGNEKLKKNIETIRDELKETRDELLKKSGRLYFWDANAVIVTTTGTKYHTYGCSTIQGSPYYIYNLENAVYKGYKPCLVCNPPK